MRKPSVVADDTAGSARQPVLDLPDVTHRRARIVVGALRDRVPIALCLVAARFGLQATITAKKGVKMPRNRHAQPTLA